MGFFRILPSSFLVFFLRFALVNGDCSYSNCTANMNMYYKDQISFPFRAPDQPETCGLPGFDLGCNNSNQTPLLSFPSGQSFTVDSIYYYLKGIWITDPQGCLPNKLLHNLNTSGTPFWFDDYTHFSIYSCSSRPLSPSYYNSDSSCSMIYCGGGPPYSVVCVNNNSSVLNDHGCEFTADVMVPGKWTQPSYFTITKGISMNWDLPAACRRCKGRCHRSSKDFSKIKCNVFTPGVIASISIAVIVAIAVTICIVCKYDRRISGRFPNVTIGTTPVATNRRQSNVASAGVVGQDTLDTYPIVVVGESGRMLRNMEDKTCPICLSDYASKDTLKILPECLHRFHADCIDEWLRSKPVCPICRTPPPLRS